MIKRELSEQVAHIRKLESTNREQSKELKHFRQIHKAVEVVEEEKSVLKSKLSVMEDMGKTTSRSAASATDPRGREAIMDIVSAE